MDVNAFFTKLDEFFAGNEIDKVDPFLCASLEQAKEEGYTKKQAAALGYGYYIAAFNSRIDAYIIRTYLDDPEEKKGGLYLGLMDSSHKKKQAYDVYKYVDTVQSTDYMKKYLSTVGISSWKKKIPNFNADKLNAGDF